MLLLKKIGLFSLISYSLIITSCKDNDGDDKDDFDRQELLENYANSIIVVQYQNYQSKINELKSAYTAFKNTSNSENLATLKSALVDSYIEWQYCAPFNFGPAADIALNASTNTFPTDTSKISSNITNNASNLSSASNIDAIGLPAIEYLLYFGSDIDILNAFTVDSEATQRMNYLGELIDKLNEDVSTVINNWNSTYQSTFIAATGTDVGSSTGLLVNAINKDFEILKHAEVGIPLGKQSLDITRPDYVQGYYSDLSAEFFDAHLTSLQNAFKGMNRDQSTNGIGFDDYLIEVEAKDANGNDLTEKINSQFENIANAKNQITLTFSNAVNSETSKMDNLYQEISKTVVYLKTDLPSSIGVLITYQDNDGD